MLSSMMKLGSYRIDYFNTDSRADLNEVFAFYVRGTLEGDRPYSIRAKRHFYIGLDVIANCLGFKNLVAVYIDINWCSNLERPAYAQMKQDIHNDQFQRIFVTCLNDLFEDWVSVVDIQQLAAAKGGLEILALETTACSFKENLLQDGLKVRQIERTISCPIRF